MVHSPSRACSTDFMLGRCSRNGDRLPDRRRVDDARRRRPPPLLAFGFNRESSSRQMNGHVSVDSAHVDGCLLSREVVADSLAALGKPERSWSRYEHGFGIDAGKKLVRRAPFGPVMRCLEQIGCQIEAALRQPGAKSPIEVSGEEHTSRAVTQSDENARVIGIGLPYRSVYAVVETDDVECSQRAVRLPDFDQTFANLGGDIRYIYLAQ